jgi:hypothetical protein
VYRIRVVDGIVVGNALAHYAVTPDGGTIVADDTFGRVHFLHTGSE